MYLDLIKLLTIIVTALMGYWHIGRGMARRDYSQACLGVSLVILAGTIK